MTTIDTRPETGSSLGTDTSAGRAVSGDDELDHHG